MPEWVVPAVVGVVVAVVGFLLRSKMADMSRESSAALVEVKKIHETMLQPVHLKNAVLEMAAELRQQFSQEYYTRREAEALERKVGNGKN